ncbi:MAG: sigma-70 family RNA polymerase sigma factor [Bacteroidales bacterium]|nr:sigma-70 family RNA polymerase sigma factor [Bacteroidales bacterium]
MNSHETYTNLLREHTAIIWSMCQDASPNDLEHCRDLFQDVAMRLWMHIEEVRPDAQPHEKKAWVEWQARHVIEHAGRRQRPEPLDVSPDLPDDHTDEEIRTLVNDLMAQLPSDDRHLLQMRMEGYSADEIATDMGLKRDAVYQRWHRILARLRKVMIVLIAILATSAVAVALVPQWHEAVFNSKTPAADDSLPEKGMSQPARNDTSAPQVLVDWDYHGLFPWGDSVWHGGTAMQFDREAGTVTFYRTSGGRVIRAVMHNAPAAYFESHISNNDSMNTALKQAASAAVAMALAVATQAQVAHDFPAVTPQGDTLFCTVTDSAQHHVSVRGDESVWNAPYIHYSDTLVIPSTVEHGGEQYTVTALADSAFYNHGEIKAVTIPSTITAIGCMALAATGIFELEVPDGVETIGAKAFSLIANIRYHGAADGSPWGARTVNGYEEEGLFYTDSSRTAVTACRSWMTQAALPASVRSIRPQAFILSNLESITLPEGLETIGNSAFQSCSQLGSIVIPSTVTEIGRYAFYNAFRTSGEAMVTIADAECSIGQGAFYYCNMSAIDLGSRVTSIGSDAFASLNRTDSIILPNSVTYLAPRAFCYNYNGRLKKVHLPAGLDTIRDELLHGCTGLRKLDIPPTVVYIGEMALAELNMVKELTLPAGLTYLGPWALGSCARINKMTSLAAVPPQACDNTFDGMNANLTLTVPCHSSDTYQSDPHWSYFSNIQEDCEGIGIQPTENEEKVKISVINGCVNIEGCDGDKVRVFDIEGRLVAEADCHGHCSIPLPTAGIYLVQVGNLPSVKTILP